ncbi:MAG: nucleotidyltransferase domain-containing protein [Chloroflexi bacterium]|nr:nucleotidyltransferase domain-containing protein [Chloroflexota bacterium]
MTNPNPDKQQALQAARCFARVVQKAGIHLDAAFLYGSFALGTAHEHSDIDIALISKDFAGRHSDWKKIPSTLDVDSRIQHVRYRLKDFRDENPLVWEIKTTGISLLGKPSEQFRIDPNRPLKIRAVEKFWTHTAEHHWQTVKTMFRVRRYLYALSFGTLYVEALLKRAIVYHTRAHAPFRLPLNQLAEKAGLALTPAQHDLLTRSDTYTIEADAPDHPLFARKFTRQFCQSEIRAIQRFGKLLYEAHSRKR